MSLPAVARPNFGQLYLSRLSLAKPAKLNFFKTPASDIESDVVPEFLNVKELRNRFQRTQRIDSASL
jgi:hypothetical protein